MQPRLRSWWRHERQSIAAALATFKHHSAPRSREEDHEISGAQERVLRHAVEQVADSVPVVLALDAPVLQMGCGKVGSVLNPWEPLPPDA